MEEYFRKLRVMVLIADRTNIGREVISSVPGRETAEDLAVGIDVLAEELWKKTLKKFQKCFPQLRKIRTISEHFPDGYGSTNPTILGFLDPFDGSDEYLKRLANSWYCAISFVSIGGVPLAAGMLDILAGKMYFISQESKEYEPGKKLTRVVAIGGTPRIPAWVLSLFRRFLGAVVPKVQMEVEARPDSRTKVPHRESAAIAAYMGRSKYLLPLIDMLGVLLPSPETRQKNYRQITWHGKGGSFAYALIADGTLIAYIMPNEPVSEILPGLAFALLAGFPIVIMQEDGTWVPFNLAVHGKWERVPALVAACTQGMADDIIRRTHIV